jgi:hypothetical protein
VTEKLNGSGKVFKGQDFVADVEYDYRIQRTFKEIVTHTSRGTIPDWSGVHLQIGSTDAIMTVMAHFGERLTLQMKDGRKQDFIGCDSGGVCAVTGGPYR